MPQSSVPIVGSPEFFKFASDWTWHGEQARASWPGKIVVPLRGATAPLPARTACREHRHDMRAERGSYGNGTGIGHQPDTTKKGLAPSQHQALVDFGCGSRIDAWNEMPPGQAGAGQSSPLCGSGDQPVSVIGSSVLQFRRLSAALRRWWRGDRGVCADMPGNAVRMGAQPTAGALDPDGDRVVHKPVGQRAGDGRIAEEVAPFGKAAV